MNSPSSSAETLPPVGYSECGNAFQALAVVAANSPGAADASGSNVPNPRSPESLNNVKENIPDCVNTNQGILSRPLVTDAPHLKRDAIQCSEEFNQAVLNSALEVNEAHRKDKHDSSFVEVVRKQPLENVDSGLNPAGGDTRTEECFVTLPKEGDVRPTPRIRDTMRQSKRIREHCAERNQSSTLVAEPFQKRACLETMGPPGTASIAPVGTGLLDGTRIQVAVSPWTAEDDEKLRSLQTEHGNKWKLLAQHIPMRSAGQLRHRFSVLRNCPIAPLEARDALIARPRLRLASSSKKAAAPGKLSNVSSRRWTDAEDLTLRNLMRLHKCNWEKIGTLMARSARAVQNRSQHQITRGRDPPKIAEASVEGSSERAATRQRASLAPAEARILANAGGHDCAGANNATPPLEETAIRSSLSKLEALYAQCASNQGDNDLVLRRENLALRLAVLQSGIPNAESTSGDNAASPCEVPQQASPSGAAPPKCTATESSVEATFETYNPVVQSVLRTKMAIAWSRTTIPYLPANMLVRQTKPLANVSTDPHDWSFAILMDFMLDLVKNEDFPASHADACSAITALVDDGILVLLTKVTSSGYGYDKLAMLRHFTSTLFATVLGSNCINLRWIAVLGKHLIVPLVSWCLSNPQRRGTLKAELDNDCACLMELCSQKMTQGFPPDLARATEMCLALNEANSSAVAKLSTSTREALFSQLPLLAMLCAMHV
jgi:Myb-like DNA-binding domain